MEGQWRLKDEVAQHSSGMLCVSLSGPRYLTLPGFDTERCDAAMLVGCCKPHARLFGQSSYNWLDKTNAEAHIAPVAGPACGCRIQSGHLEAQLSRAIRTSGSRQMMKEVHISVPWIRTQLRYQHRQVSSPARKHAGSVESGGQLVCHWPADLSIKSGSLYPTPVARHTYSPHTTDPRAQSFIERLQINPAAKSNLGAVCERGCRLRMATARLNSPPRPSQIVEVTQMPACCQKLLNLRNPACWVCWECRIMITTVIQLGRHMQDRDMGLGTFAS
jgi:hypothetical protein